MKRIAVLLLALTMGTNAMAEEAPHTISVTGTGTAGVAPDRGRVNMTVMIRDKSLEAAQSQAGGITANVLELTDSLGIERKYVDTTGANISPDYRYNRDTNEQELRGYIANRNIIVDVRDLDKLAALIEGAVKAGVNQVSSPQLYSSKRRDAYREALDKAARDAHANARQLSRSLRVELGDAIMVSTDSVSVPLPQPRMARTMAVDASAEESYNAGDQSITATVTVVFAIED